MNRVTQQYLRHTELRTAMADAELPASYRDCWGDRHLSRPLFVPGEELKACADDVMGLFDLLASLPDRLFDGELPRYCAALGIDSRISRLLCGFAGGPATRYGRADLYHDGTGFRLLEFNVASDLGGLDRAELHRGLLEVPAFRRFAGEHWLDYVHLGERVARSLRAAAPCPDPVVAIVCAGGDLARYRRLLMSTVDMLRRLGLTVLAGELPEVHARNGRLYLGGARIDVVLRYFTVDHVPGNEELVAPILRAHAAGTALLWTTMDSSLYSNKGALGLLSDPRWSDAFTAAERRLIDRLLPWTRLLTPDLLVRCVADREHLILKPRREFGGTGIVAGWESSERDWRDTLASCVRKDYIVQRRVVPAAEPVVDPVTGAVEDWVATWGMLLTPEGYSGVDIRAMPADAGAVVNFGGNTTVKVSGAFSYDT